jgi:hypothetical protein
MLPVPVQFGINVQLRPDGVDGDASKVIGPVKPFTGFTVIVTVPEPPARIDDGVTVPALMEKSGPATTWYVITPVEWIKVPLVPVMVTS